jgi:hypothetical protein
LFEREGDVIVGTSKDFAQLLVTTIFGGFDESKHILVQNFWQFGPPQTLISSYLAGEYKLLYIF